MEVPFMDPRSAGGFAVILFYIFLLSNPFSFTRPRHVFPRLLRCLFFAPALHIIPSTGRKMSTASALDHPAPEALFSISILIRRP
jgi:hypothetical protein